MLVEQNGTDLPWGGRPQVWLESASQGSGFDCRCHRQRVRNLESRCRRPRRLATVLGCMLGSFMPISKQLSSRRPCLT